MRFSQVICVSLKKILILSQKLNKLVQMLHHSQKKKNTCPINIALSVLLFLFIKCSFLISDKNERPFCCCG